MNTRGIPHKTKRQYEVTFRLLSAMGSKALFDTRKFDRKKEAYQSIAFLKHDQNCDHIELVTIFRDASTNDLLLLTDEVYFDRDEKTGRWTSVEM
jgi:uncharacterized protein (DUF488 family)